MKCILLVFFIAISTIQSYAQVVINGVVRDKTSQEPIEGVVVTATNAKNQALSYDITKSNGDYSLKLNSAIGDINITFQHITYESYERIIKSNSTNLDVELEAKAIEIEEVVVRAPILSQRGDTLSYALSAFKGVSDITLEDAMRNLPGITIEESGAIKYLGRNVDNFYIEDLDLLGGRYAIATRNINADLVSSVQLIDNHQPIKMLDDKEISNKVALNIKLKNEAKSTYVGSYEASIGSRQEEELLYNLGITGMLFSKEFQTINSIKYGNAGSESTSQLTSLTNEIPKLSSLPLSVLGDIYSSKPPLDIQRYELKEDGIATMNVMKKLSEDRSMRINAGYSFEESNYGYSTISNYYIEEGILDVVTESFAPQNKEHNPYFSMQYSDNSNDRFLENTLSAIGTFTESHYPTINDLNSINQDREAIAYGINNKFSYRQNYGENILSIISDIGYTNTPENSISYRLNETQDYIQSSKGQTVFLNNNINYSLNIGSDFRLFIPILFNLSYDDIYTNLIAAETFTNDIKSGSLDIGIAPRIEYVTANKSLKAMLSSSVDYAYISLPENHQNYSKLLVKPHLDLDYTISPTSKIKLRASAGNSIGDITDFMTSPIQTNYRTTSIKSGILSENKEGSVMLRYEFKRPLSYFFMNMDVTYGGKEQNLLNSQTINGNELVNSFFLQDNQSSFLISRFFVSKLFKPIETKFNIGASYSYNEGEVFQQSEVSQFETIIYSFDGAITSRPWEWLELDYFANLGWNNSRYDEENHSLRFESHTGKLSLMPVKKLSIYGAIEYVNNEVTPSQFKSISLFDVGVKYRFKKAEIELALNNIFDNRQYSYTTFAGLNSYSYNYALRGREIMLTVRIF